MTSILFLGFLIGVRHALEADHIAVVASLATRSNTLNHALRQGVGWGLGHTITLFLFGGIVLFMNTTIPEQFAQGLEFAVGIMLVFLGADVIRRMLRDRVHYHAHKHADGSEHFHLHSHKGEQRTKHHPDFHDHQHPEGLPIRALVIGLVHGMAGSAALILLTLQTLTSPWLGLVYIALFGLGSIVGMAVFSTIIMLPLHSARSLTWAHHGLQTVIGVITIALGVFVVFETAPALFVIA